MNNCVFELIPSIGDGGAETLVKDYCLHIDKDLIKIVVITIIPPSKNTACYQILSSSGIEMISIYSKTQLFRWGIVNKIWNKLFNTLYVTKRLINIVSLYKPVAIHAHLSVLRYLKKAGNSLDGIRLFATCHSEFDKNFNIPTELKAAHYLSRKGKIRFIALHRKMQAEINQRFNCDNTIIINNGVDFNRFVNYHTKDEVRKIIGIPLKSFVVGHVGRFNDVKNHTFLVDVFAELKRKRPNAFLLMIGDGVNKQMILDKLENLHLTNSSIILSNRDDVNVLLKAMDVFLFPSLYEGLPVSLVEAQVVGLRSIVSDTITEDCFFSENLITLSLTDSVDKWVECILDDTIKSKYNRNISEYDMNSVIHKLEDLYLGKI